MEISAVTSSNLVVKIISIETRKSRLLIGRYLNSIFLLAQLWKMTRILENALKSVPTSQLKITASRSTDFISSELGQYLPEFKTEHIVKIS